MYVFQPTIYIYIYIYIYIGLKKLTKLHAIQNIFSK